MSEGEWVKVSEWVEAYLSEGDRVEGIVNTNQSLGRLVSCRWLGCWRGKKRGKKMPRDIFEG